MDKAKALEIAAMMKKYIEKKEWCECLQAVQAEDGISDDYSASYHVLDSLAFVYCQASQYPDVHNKYVKLAVEAYEHILAIPGFDMNMKALKGLAYVYYSEWISYLILSKKVDGPLAFDKNLCKDRAIELYERILVRDCDVTTLYRYAHLLYRVSSEYRPGGDYQERLQARRQSYHLYSEAKNTYEQMEAGDEKKRFRKNYIKACYGLSRCIIDMIHVTNTLDETIDALFGRTPVYDSYREWKRKKLMEAANAINIVRDEEGLPVTTDDTVTLAMQEQKFEMSWDIYYTMGKIYETAFFYDFFNDRQRSFDKAEKYYTYACDIDFNRRRANKNVSGFKHIYAKLLDLYVKGHEAEKYDACRSKYEPYFRVNGTMETIYKAKWAIIEHDYALAADLVGRIDTKQIRLSKTEKSEHKALEAIVAILAGVDAATLTGKFTRNQMKRLQELQAYLAGEMAS